MLFFTKRTIDFLAAFSLLYHSTTKEQMELILLRCSTRELKIIYRFLDTQLLFAATNNNSSPGSNRANERGNS